MGALGDMLTEVKKEYFTGAYETMNECLNDYIRRNKYWPMLQTKKISNELTLLHNTYIRNDVEHFKELYDESRSVVLDMNGLTIVVSLADKIPTTMSMEDYGKVMNTGDIYEKAYEGTMVYAYNYKDVWHFGTSTCSSIDNSRYFHPTKTHGEMFNEALKTYLPETETEQIRDEFCKLLNPDEAYGFLLVHYENCNTMNYAEEFQNDMYAVIFHIFTKEKTNGMMKKGTNLLENIGITNTKTAIINCTEGNLSVISSSKYETDFTYPSDFIEMFEDKNTYGIIIRSADKIYRVSNDEILNKETKNRANYNPWVNMLSVYMQCNPEYTVEKYIDEYLPSEKTNFIIKDLNGMSYNPTVIIHEVMKSLCDMLYGTYRETTYYNKNTRRYIMNHEIDASLAPIIRFHLAQLRNMQITSHAHAPLNYKAIRHYLCIKQSIKNIRLLIAYFTTIIQTPPRTVSCFVMLNSLLKM